MKSRSIILLAISLLFGVVAAIGIAQVVKRNGQNQPKIEMGQVLVAVDHMDVNTVLTEELVKVENWPRKIIPEDALRSLEEIEDMALTARLSRDLPLTKSNVQHKNKRNIVSIPPGFRVYGMKVSADSTMTGILSPGDNVDVIGTFRVKNRDSGDQKTVSATFLKNIRVFSIGNNMKSTRNDESSGSKSSAIVGVLVNNKQAEQIALVEKEGEIKIIMRGVDEDDTPADSLDEILSQYETPQAPQDDFAMEDQDDQTGKPVMRQMIIWSGSEPEVVTFNGSQLPKSNRETPAASNSNDSDDEDDLDEVEGDFEEDQYPGE